MKKIFASLALLVTVTATAAANAQTRAEGMAKPWQLGLQDAATPVMERLTSVHNLLLVIITLITLLVLALMTFICIRFNKKRNPVPSKTTHNTALEIAWTSIPILILIVIAIPSLRLHYYMEKPVNPEMTLKVVGYQWYWHYDYPDQGGFGYDSTFVKEKDLKPGDHRQLAVDNHVVVPVDTTVRVLITGADVIHSWAVPSFGLKRDAIPGRLNETWFKATKLGTFYGQCSQLCGVGHGFMPIAVDVVSKEDFASWAKEKQLASNGGAAPAAPVTGSTSPEKVEKPSSNANTPLAEPTKLSPDLKPHDNMQDNKQTPNGDAGQPEKQLVAPAEHATPNDKAAPATSQPNQ